MMMFRYFPGRMMGGGLFSLILTVLLIVGIVLLIVFLTSRRLKAPTAANAPAAPAAQDRFLTMLTEQKAASGMGAQEFEKRKLVLEGARADNHANAEVISLKERYARGELTTSAYVEARLKLSGTD